MTVSGRIKKFLFEGGVAARRFILWDGVRESEIADQPTFTSGSGAPSSLEPNGSVYVRRDGTSATTVYVRAVGAWVAVVADGSDFGAGGILADLVKASTENAAIVVESNGTATSVKFKSAGTTATHRTVTFSTAALTGDRTLTMPNANVDLTIVSGLAGTTTGVGASLVGVEDAGADFAGATVEAVLAELGAYVMRPIADPGDAGAIPITKSAYVPLVTGGAETRTVADPTKVGLRLCLHFLTKVGGNCVITFASPFNAAGHNTLTHDTAGEQVVFESTKDGASAFAWRVVANEAATPSAQV